MSESMLVWLQFGICALLIAFAGMKLSRYGDAIADKTGWSGSWVGLFLLATVTSLPEFATCWSPSSAWACRSAIRRSPLAMLVFLHQQVPYCSYGD